MKMKCFMYGEWGLETVVLLVGTQNFFFYDDYRIRKKLSQNCKVSLLKLAREAFHFDSLEHPLLRFPIKFFDLFSWQRHCKGCVNMKTVTIQGRNSSFFHKTEMSCFKTLTASLPSTSQEIHLQYFDKCDTFAIWLPLKQFLLVNLIFISFEIHSHTKIILFIIS